VLRHTLIHCTSKFITGGLPFTERASRKEYGRLDGRRKLIKDRKKGNVG
jgi:hypothetical protein